MLMQLSSLTGIQKCELYSRALSPVEELEYTLCRETRCAMLFSFLKQLDKNHAVRIAVLLRGQRSSSKTKLSAKHALTCATWQTTRAFERPHFPGNGWAILWTWPRQKSLEGAWQSNHTIFSSPWLVMMLPNLQLASYDMNIGLH